MNSLKRSIEALIFCWWVNHSSSRHHQRHLCVAMPEVYRVGDFNLNPLPKVQKSCLYLELKEAIRKDHFRILLSKDKSHCHWPVLTSGFLTMLMSQYCVCCSAPLTVVHPCLYNVFTVAVSGLAALHAEWGRGWGHWVRSCLSCGCHENGQIYVASRYHDWYCSSSSAGKFCALVECYNPPPSPFPFF